jgi:hypothetical protein
MRGLGMRVIFGVHGLINDQIPRPKSQSKPNGQAQNPKPPTSRPGLSKNHFNIFNIKSRCAMNKKNALRRAAANG